jgi:hypothetical protein
MQQARAAGKKLLESDEVHLSFEGYRVMTQAVLDALGEKQLTVPKELKLSVMPGVIRAWQIRAVAEKEPALDEKSVAALRPDASWKSYTLPEEEAHAQWWFNQERQRGFAVSLGKRVGPAKSYLGLATLTAEKPRRAYFNTGAQIQAIWLNGKRIYKNEGWTGWHAGKERIPAELQAGKNAIVVETGPEFFLSVTDRNDW